MKKLTLFYSILFYILITSCNSSSSIKSVEIGNQIWMSENLNVDKFRNGDPIPEAKTDDEWAKATDNKSPAWCYYENDSSNGKKYGKLYNWYAVNDPRGLAPEGWHIPSGMEWVTLINNLGFEKAAGIKMKSKDEWEDKKGTNSSGFNGLPGGYRESVGPIRIIGHNSFQEIGVFGGWWSSASDRDYNSATYFYLKNNEDELLKIEIFTRDGGYSVRCIKD